jgi:predicted ATPase
LSAKKISPGYEISGYEMKTTPLAGFIIEETGEDAPLRVSRAKRSSDEQAAVIYEFFGAPLSPAELSRWRNELGAQLLAHENTASGSALAIAQSGTPLRARALPLSGEDFLPRAVQLTESLGRIHDDSGFHGHLCDASIFVDEGATHLLPPPLAALIFAQMQGRGQAGDEAAQGWTLRFIAPEQTGRMNCTPDNRADLYALGVVFYQMATGHLPFETLDALELVHGHLAKAPLAPHAVNPKVPAALSDIILKLLAKAPEDRYQGTFGLLQDLRECEARRQSDGQIEAFELGRRDVSERLLVPHQLYGREAQVAAINEAFERVQSDGEAILLLISGYSGVGKTVLAQALRPAITQAGGYFLSGKIDQFRRNWPYVSITEAFQGFVRQLQTESENRIAKWREELQSALGDNGQVIADVIPEIESIIGPQAPVPILEPGEAMNRFNAVFQALVGVLARPGQPLVLFLDDLQWMDSASLKLVESLMGSARNLLLIGAFRDNEVSVSHPLTATAQRIELGNAARVRRITVSPLAHGDVTQLLADTLHASRSEVKELSHLLTTKTDGNVFFLIQFLHALHARRLLRFNRAQGEWTWDAEQIQQADISGDVVELMAGKIRKLSPKAREILPVAACLGNRFEVDALALVRGQTRDETLANLRDALDAGLLLPAAEEAGELQTLRFLHDRVQQAAYSLLSETEKSALHARAGRLLAQQAREVGEALFEERLFDIANHLNNGVTQLKNDEERGELAQLNLRAALKAKNALAYEGAQRYAAAGIEVLPQKAPPALAFELHFERCENELLLGDLNAMGSRFDELFALAITLTQKARAYDLKVLYFTTHTMLPQAAEVGLEGLRLLGFAVPDTISKATIVQEIARVKWIQGRRKTEDLLGLPQVNDAEQLAMLKLLSNVIVVTFFSDANLFAVLILKLTALSMKIGNSPIAPMGYGCYGIILCSPLGDYKAGYEFGQLAMELSRRSQNNRLFRARL